MIVIINKNLLLWHLFCCSYHCICDARSQIHQNKSINDIDTGETPGSFVDSGGEKNMRGVPKNHVDIIGQNIKQAMTCLFVVPRLGNHTVEF